MASSEIIFSLILLLLSVISFVISYRQWKEKGFLFNNSYIYASKKERETMNKKPYYKQSAIAFFLIGILLFLVSAGIFMSWQWMLYVGIIFSLFLIIYAIVSSVSIERKRK